MTSRAWPVLLMTLGACGGARTPATEPKIASPPPTTVEVAPSPAEQAPAVATAPLEPLPRHAMLPDAVSLVVIDVAALRALGLRDGLRLLAREQVGAEALPCLEPLLDETRRVVLTRATFDVGTALAIEQPRPVEPLLDCLSTQVPGASARAIADRAGLELRAGTIAVDVDGTLVVGNHEGLASLLGVPKPPPPEGERPLGDVLLDESALVRPEPPGLDALIAQLPNPSGRLLVTAVQHLGSLSVGGGRAAIRATDDGLHAHLDILGFAEQISSLQSAPGTSHDNMLDQVVESARSSFSASLSGHEDAGPILAALDQLRIEERGPDVRLSIDVRRVEPIVKALEGLARTQLAVVEPVPEPSP